VIVVSPPCPHLPFSRPPLFILRGQLLRAILLGLNGYVAPDQEPATVNEGRSPTVVTTRTFCTRVCLCRCWPRSSQCLASSSWTVVLLAHRRINGRKLRRYQHRFNGLEKLPFRQFTGSLPIMIRIDLVLLTYGLSQYAWSGNTLAARAVRYPSPFSVSTSTSGLWPPGRLRTNIQCFLS
jgi:hypothetical protein